MRRRGFLLALTTCGWGIRTSQAASDSLDCVAAVSRRRDEAQLLNRSLSSVLAGGLSVWDDRRGGWASPPAGHVAFWGRVVLLHLWADYCKPCREEFPHLRDLKREFVRHYKGRVQLVLISETASFEEMQRFLKQNRSRMPDGPLYLDDAGALAQALRAGLPSGSLPLPVTLLCDERLIVRQVFLGALSGRHDELHDAIERLVNSLSAATPQAGGTLGTKNSEPLVGSQ